MISSMVEKLKMVREAEDKAVKVLEFYQRMTEEAIAEAQDDVAKMREREEAKARSEGEEEMKGIIELAGKEAEELRIEYMYDRMRLLAEVVDRRKDAVAFLVEKLEKGE